MDKNLEEIRKVTEQENYIVPDAKKLAWASMHGLEDWFSGVGNENIIIDWSAEFLTLYGAAEVLERQNGYDGEDWRASWIVLGDIFSNPIIYDSADGCIYVAKHGMGSWTPTKLAPNLEGFIKIIRLWCDLFYIEFKGDILDEDFEVVGEFMSKFLKGVKRISGDEFLEGMNIAIKG